MAETPITFVDRTRGQSKIDLGEAWSALGVILRLGVRSLQFTGTKKPRAASRERSTRHL